MKKLLPVHHAASLLVAASCLATAPEAQAQSSDGWQFEAALYGWFPAISGTTSFPPDGGGPSIGVSMGDVLDSLKMAFFGALQVRNGEWGLFTDLAYADLGATKSRTRDFTIDGLTPPLGVDARLSLDVKTWIWTLAGTYQLKNDQDAMVDLLFGARMLDMSNTLDWNINGTGGNLPPLTGSKEVGATNWDGVVGLKGRAFLGPDRKWFVPFYADVGTGESKLTWQLNAGVGYQFDWGALIATWRYLDYDFKSSSHVQSMSLNGPTVGVLFKF